MNSKVVLITGASSGLGRELAIQLLSRGYKVGCIARRENLLASLKTQTDKPDKLLCINADVKDLNQIKIATTKTEEVLGPIDILVANAGICPHVPSDGKQPEIERNIVETNLIGFLNSIHSVLDGMKSRKRGQIVAISSLAAYLPFPKVAAYAATKAALNSYMESLHIQLKPLGIDTTIICPGFIDTPLFVKQDNLPFIMNLSSAATRIINALQNKKRILNFPFFLYAIIKISCIVPQIRSLAFFQRLNDFELKKE